MEIERPSLTDIAYQEIRDSILIGKLLPGDKLVVNDLVDGWKISNTPIKEALNRLVADGLVETLPRRGMRVRLFTDQEVREFFELRELYETHCCRVAVDVMDDNPQVLEEMQAALDKSRALLDGEASHLLQFQLDGMFHLLIVGLCGNNTLIRDFDRLHAYIIMVAIYASKWAPPENAEKSCQEHSLILEGLKNRSKRETVNAMRAHLARAAERTRLLYLAAADRERPREA